MTSFLRNLRRASLIGVGLGLATGAVAAGWLWRTLPQIEGRAAVAGIASPVEVRRDLNGIPTIRASSERDAYFALGYVHAQDRLWQMEMTRRLGAGRLAEVLGERALGSDRYMRLLGLYRLAERQADEAEPDMRQALDAYASGVDAWVSGHPGFLPLEYGIFRFEPEPWRPADSLVWLKIMATRLSGNWRDEALRGRLLDILSPAQVDALWPPYPADGPTTMTATALPARPPGLEIEYLATVDPEPAGLPRSASNVWAISGDRTVGGKPILANDPHLAFQAPVLWYLARIETPDRVLAGATVPGFPFHVVGHNGRIAWGLTSVGTDLEDLFVERIDPLDGGRYLAPGGSRPFGTRNEIIKRRGNEDTVLVVRETRHGPVLSDLIGAPADTSTVLAFAAAYLDTSVPDRTPQGLLSLNRASNWAEFVEAMRTIAAPQQNVFYADVDGNIGFLAPGRVPVRKPGQGRLPAEGATGEADWLGFIPFDRLPRAFNPSAGVLVNANNPSGGPGYPYYLADSWDAPQRAQRIVGQLDALKNHSPEASARLQMDDVSLTAQSLIPLMARGLAPRDDMETKALALLAAWDGTMDRTRPEPLIFTAWLRAFSRAIYADDLGALTDDYWGLRSEFVLSVLKGPNEEWCDNRTTEAIENCSDIALASLGTVLAELQTAFGSDPAKWRWGDAHVARFRHPVLSGIPLLGRLADIEIATNGGNDTINRGSSPIRGRDMPYGHVHGAGLRAVFDLGRLDGSGFVIATGQSGNPASPHYRDLLTPWRDGALIEISGNAATDRILHLVPMHGSTLGNAD